MKWIPLLPDSLSGSGPTARGRRRRNAARGKPGRVPAPATPSKDRLGRRGETRALKRAAICASQRRHSALSCPCLRMDQTPASAMSLALNSRCFCRRAGGRAYRARCPGVRRFGRGDSRRRPCPWRSRCWLTTGYANAITSPAATATFLFHPCPGWRGAVSNVGLKMYCMHKHITK